MDTNDLGQVIVPCRECRCPGTPGAFHPTDLVYLAPQPSLTIAMEMQFILEDAQEEAKGDQKLFERATVRRLLPLYVTLGVVGWNLVDAEGNALPLDTAAILADLSLSRPASDAASGLYTQKVIAPLGPTPSATLPAGRTVNSNSPARRSMSQRRGSSSPPASAASLRSMP
jgi:hypothetical protein